MDSGVPNPLEDMDRGGPYLLADLDRGSKSARTPAWPNFSLLVEYKGATKAI